MNFRIRRLQPQDRPRWNQLWDGYLAFYKYELPAPVTQLTWRRLLDPDQPLQGLVALGDEEAAIGMAHYQVHSSTWAANGYCYLEDLFVDPTCRSRGAGRALIEAVYHAADERGAEQVYWHTRNSNIRAQMLYHRVAELTPFVQFRRRRS